MSMTNRWAWLLTTVGSVAMLIGAIDPLEGSLLILPGSGLVAIGSWVGAANRRATIHRLRLFLCIAVGVAALWALSAVGGIGGSSGRSYWLGLLILPYLVGWSLSIQASDSPRWVWQAGIMLGLWYVALPAMIWWRTTSPHRVASIIMFFALAATGIATIAGCVNRLRDSRGA